jgi:hypothetical protein
MSPEFSVQAALTTPFDGSGDPRYPTAPRAPL